MASTSSWISGGAAATPASYKPVKSGEVTNAFTDSGLQSLAL